jgi:hypothetical protein
MPINQLATEVLSISGVPDDNINAALVGDAVSFAPQQTFASATVTLTRKPAGSAASVSSNAVTFDVAGYYTVTVAAGGFSRTITTIVFPVTVLSQKAQGNSPSSPNVNRSHLQALARDGRLTLANITTALETASPSTVGLIPGGFSWQSYGN